ncbi:DUF3365 domain-containing protein [Mastigocoleus sp. MO_188.B34]|uniref:Tll0287-like domain-containing protein n=1 Tax=Mastigocoleus sp. MO_188.B34 TaxID=3036635 RepID=UPI002627C751|nr:DUF3365 domain-containing protein [Mastigocoleus sp. MO_188.B34]MDJ0694443.1 DUF3365 domain-containing protein [Mastigocoleus sp. MO_188.B34]
MKIGKKVNIILILVFVSGILISGFALSQVLEQKAKNEISSNARDIMHMVNSIRKYTNTQVEPILEPKFDTKEVFIPQAIPSYSVREVFEIFRSDKKYSNFLYKDATLNPVNLRDKADVFEAKIVNNFKNSSNLKSINGFRNIYGENLFYIARPFKIEDESCLRCHSTPEKAPRSQILTYGRKNGFGWKLNEIVATQIIYVPAQEIFNNVGRSFYLVIGVLSSVFAFIAIAMNIFLKKIILRRIKNIAKVAEKVSIGDIEAKFDKQDKDEIGALAESFNRMRYSLEIAVNMLNKKIRQ